MPTVGKKRHRYFRVLKKTFVKILQMKNPHIYLIYVSGLEGIKSPFNQSKRRTGITCVYNVV